MRFSLSNVVEADLDEIVHIISIAITDPEQGNPGGEWIAATWPRITTPEGRENAKTRLSAILKAMPEGAFVKVIDREANDKPVAMAIWNTYLQPPEQLPALELGDFWADADEKEYGQQIWNGTNAEFLRHYSAFDGPFIALEIMTVLPSYKRRGIGRMLMEDGLLQAKKLNCAMFVNATSPGRLLYERFGFQMAANQPHVIPKNDKWSYKPASRVQCMIRPKDSA